MIQPSMPSWKESDITVNSCEGDLAVHQESLMALWELWLLMIGRLFAEEETLAE
jgi:hypothetical protein